LNIIRVNVFNNDCVAVTQIGIPAVSAMYFILEDKQVPVVKTQVVDYLSSAKYKGKVA
jgi:hypothetical protein